MSKAEYIKESYIKEQLEKEEHNENEFYAEQYLGDLKMQYLDSEKEQPKDIVLLEVVMRVKPYLNRIEDLNEELTKLKKIENILNDFDNSYYTPEIIKNVLNMINNRIDDIKADFQTEVFEICQITEDVSKRFK